MQVLWHKQFDELDKSKIYWEQTNKMQPAISITTATMSISIFRNFLRRFVAGGSIYKFNISYVLLLHCHTTSWI